VSYLIFRLAEQMDCDPGFPSKSWNTCRYSMGWRC
jgi:hypothetical protein